MRYTNDDVFQRTDQSFTDDELGNVTGIMPWRSTEITLAIIADVVLLALFSLYIVMSIRKGRKHVKHDRAAVRRASLKGVAPFTEEQVEAKDTRSGLTTEQVLSRAQAALCRLQSTGLHLAAGTGELTYRRAMSINSAAVAEEYVSRMTDEQLQRFQERWAEFSKKQDLGLSQLLIDSGTLKAFSGAQKKIQADLAAIIERTGMMDDLQRRIAEITDRIDIPQIEFSEETRRNIQRLAGFDVPLDNPVAVARLGAAWLDDPDAAEFRTEVNAVFDRNTELDEEIRDIDVIAVGGGEYVYVSREQVQFGVRLVIFGLWCAISLHTAGAPELAVFVLQSIGFDGSLLGGLAISDYLAKKIVPNKSKPQDELPDGSS